MGLARQIQAPSPCPYDMRDPREDYDQKDAPTNGLDVYGACPDPHPYNHVGQQGRTQQRGYGPQVTFRLGRGTRREFSVPLSRLANQWWRRRPWCSPGPLACQRPANGHSPISNALKLPSRAISRTPSESEQLPVEHRAFQRQE